jgi:hypothetical protein
MSQKIMEGKWVKQRGTRRGKMEEEKKEEEKKEKEDNLGFQSLQGHIPNDLTSFL